MAKKVNIGVYVAPNNKFKRYHKLYTKSVVVINQSTSVNKYAKEKLSKVDFKVFDFNYEIKATEYLRLPSEQLEACLKISRRILKKKGSLLPMVYTYLPLTKKPSETRMGKGKSSRISKWVCSIKPGKVIFSISAKNYDLVQQVYKCVCDRLPIKLVLVTT